MTSPLPILHNAVEIMTPFLLAALGGLLTELAGMLNIALEGLILLGAFFGIVFTSLLGNAVLGVLAGALVVMAAALFFGVVTIYLKSNIFITGLATNLMAGGLIAVLSFHIFRNKGVIRFPELAALPRLSGGRLSDIPVLGDILFNHTPFVYASWGLTLLAFLFLYKTPWGFRLRGTGRNPLAVEAVGLQPRFYQLGGIVFSGFACALAGASLSLGVGAFVPGISAGRGWTALVVIYLGNRHPWGILGAAFFFALAESLSNWIQGVTALPSDLILALPYAVTVTILVTVSGIRRRRSL